MLSFRLRSIPLFTFTALAVACSSGDPAGIASVPPGAGSSSLGSSSPVPSREQWRRVMSKTPLPKEGCFDAIHPSVQWVEVPCATGRHSPPPHRPMTTRTIAGSGGVRPLTSGTVSSGTISWAEGSFPSATVSGENDNGTSNDFSLQLNTQSNLTNSAITALCKSTATPSSCTGWVQFVYWEGAAEIWYNLIGAGSKCPSSAWQNVSGSCYYEAPKTAAISTQAISNLVNMTVTGVAGGATDTVIVTTGPGQMHAAINTSLVDLAPDWTYADFNVLGNGSYGTATFNSGTTLTVQLLTDSATGNTSAPTCGPYDSTTGESNSLTFVPGSCCTFGGETPGIQFSESNVSGAAAQACPYSHFAFQSNTTALWVGETDMGLGMMGGTSPSIATMPSGAWQAAFQANTGNLWVVGTQDDCGSMGLGMMAGTSPSIASMPSGAWEAAFQANTGNLWVIGTQDDCGSMGLGMMAGTSPSITSMPSGAWEAAFQANTGNLWVVGTQDDCGSMGLGMMAGTSPSITSMPSGAWEAAFQANTGNLWVVGTQDDCGSMGLGMMGGTSPSITGLSTGAWEAAFEANTGNLWVVGTQDDPGDTGLGMMRGTSPQIAATADGGWQVAFQANTGELWIIGNMISRGDTGLAMAAGTSPSIAR